MIIREVKENKKQFISLLLLADEQENMIDRYIEKGTMYVLKDDNVKAECVVTDEGNGILEIKNIAVNPENQGMGYGKTLIDFIASQYADEYSILQVGTGDSPLTIPFYSRFRSRRPLPPDPYCSAPTQPPPLAAAWPWQVIGKNAKLNRRRDTFVSEISEFRHRRRD